MTYEYKCPNCGSTDEIHISVSLLVKLVQEEDEDLFGTEVIDGSHEWDDASLANCTKCNWHGEVYDLQEHDKGKAQ